MYAWRGSPMQIKLQSKTTEEKWRTNVLHHVQIVKPRFGNPGETIETNCYRSSRILNYCKHKIKQGELVCLCSITPTNGFILLVTTNKPICRKVLEYWVSRRQTNAQKVCCAIEIAILKSMKCIDKTNHFCCTEVPGIYVATHH